MAAYNKVNGVYSCENNYLLTDILRDDWKFNGFVLSDWGGTHSTAASANSGMDVEMPRVRWYGDKLLAAVKVGQVTEKTIDKMVSNVLRVVFWSGAFDQGPLYKKEIIRSKEQLGVARKASVESMVLLKNDSKVLPFNLSKIKKIAVIGPNGDYGLQFQKMILVITENLFLLNLFLLNLRRRFYCKRAGRLFLQILKN
jgi:beta-glucosidase